MRLISCLLAACALASCGGRAEPTGNLTIRNLGPSQMHFVTVKTPDRSYTVGDIAPDMLKAVQVDAPTALYIDFHDDHGRAFTYTLDQSRLKDNGRLEVQIKANRLVDGSAW